jgi:hypothetical protein
MAESWDADVLSQFATFFGTKGQPNKPARTTVQVAGLVAAGPLLEGPRLRLDRSPMRRDIRTGRAFVGHPRNGL